MSATHGRLWLDDRFYRLSWLILPQAVAVLVALFLLFPSHKAGQGEWAQSAFSEAHENRLNQLRDKAVNDGDTAALNKLGEYVRNNDAMASFKMGTVYDPTLAELFPKRKNATSAQKALDYYEFPVKTGLFKAKINMVLLLTDSTPVRNVQRGCALLRDMEATANTELLKHTYETMILADCYIGTYASEGVLPDTAKAIPLLEAAAAKGHAGALNKLGAIYEYGQYGKDKDLFKARKYYEQADAAGDTGAMMSLSEFYADGLGGLPKDPVQARRLLEKAAAAGDASANVNLGVMYANGANGVVQDHAQAAVYYRKAADLGSAEAMNNLGDLYKRGEGGLPKDYQQAALFFAKAIEKKNSFTINLFLNRTNLFDADMWKAMQTHLKQRGFAIAAVDGTPNAETLDAIRALANGGSGAPAKAEFSEAELETRISKYGVDGLRDKVGKDGDKVSLQALQRLADKGDVNAKYWLGTLYDPRLEKLYPMKPNYSDGLKAMALYKPAADAGNAAAMVNLGRLLGDKNVAGHDMKRACAYLDGGLSRLSPPPDDEAALAAVAGDCFSGSFAKDGMATNLPKAVSFYEKAANAGHDSAQFALGEAYWIGNLGLAKDLPKARKYLEMAAAKNNARALSDLGDMNAQGIAGFAQDYGAARKLFEQCAALDHAWCVGRLGVYNELGLGGFGKDMASAIRYYQRAAALGDGESMRFLGAHTYNGNAIIVADHTQAGVWFAKALKAKNESTVTQLTNESSTFNVAFWRSLQNELKTIGYAVAQSGTPDTATLRAVRALGAGQPPP